MDDTARPTNILLMSETTEQVNEFSENNLPTAKQESIEEVESAINIPKSLKHTEVSKDRHWPYLTTSTSTEKYITALYRLRQKLSTTLIMRPG